MRHKIAGATHLLPIVVYSILPKKSIEIPNLFKKEKGSSQRGSGNKVPSHLNESPFANSIAETELDVKSSDETYSDVHHAWPNYKKAYSYLQT